MFSANLGCGPRWRDSAWLRLSSASCGWAPSRRCPADQESCRWRHLLHPCRTRWPHCELCTCSRCRKSCAGAIAPGLRGSGTAPRGRLSSPNPISEPCSPKKHKHCITHIFLIFLFSKMKLNILYIKNTSFWKQPAPGSLWRSGPDLLPNNRQRRATNREHDEMWTQQAESSSAAETSCAVHWLQPKLNRTWEHYKIVRHDALSTIPTERT